MNESEKEKLLRSFELYVSWLRNNIPPDDIYEFTQQLLLACAVFMRDIEFSEDFKKKMDENFELLVWYTNVSALLDAQGKGIPIKINFDFLYD